MKPNISDLRPPLFYIPPKYHKEANDFFSLYDMEEYIPGPPIQLGNLKLPKDRVCRFCGNSMPVTSFRTKAHFFPEMLGSRYLLSDFECDACNSIISKYENDLANFLGVARTLNVVSGKNGVPKYKDRGSSLELVANRSEQTILLSRSNAADQSIRFDESTNNLIIEFTCNPYVPINVYKSILKIALSVLPEKYIDNYQGALRFVAGDTFDDVLKGSKIVACTILPLTYYAKFPIGMLFRKRGDDMPTFTHFFCLYFQNFIFQTVIPLNKEDLSLHNNQPVTIPICPLLCPTADSAKDANEFMINSYNFDLSSKHLKRDDKRSMHIGMDEERIKYWKEKLTVANNVSLFDLNKIVEIQFSRDT